jgi:pilus assembly protein CpaB
VILTRREREAEKRAGGDVHTSTTILSNIRVLAIDQAVEEKNGQRVVVGKTATLELAQLQAERLALSRQLGSLSLALRSIADTNAAAQNDAPRENVITVQRGVDRETFNCLPRCERRMTSGDGADASNAPPPAPPSPPSPRNTQAQAPGNTGQQPAPR